jgi:hypothetical protein
MWFASLDTRTGRYPIDDRRPAQIPRRHYRAIDAPRGASLYWDQPALIAAHTLSSLCGDPRYARAATDYVHAFLRRCTAANGMLLWGNHYYWDAARGVTVRFVGEEAPVPVDLATERGDLHEARPIPPAWELFWQVDAPAAARAIRGFVTQSAFDPATGGFNRHADGRRGCAFLESGGILAEAAAWLHARQPDRDLLALGGRMAGFSAAAGDARTGLLPVNPTQNRWDRHACTTEVGLWAGCLLRAASATPDCAPWIAPAADAMRAYLRHGWDHATGRYWGRLNVADGSPVRGVPEYPGDDALSRKHQPGDYADPWRPLFPAHDYPLPFAETCLDLWRLTGEPVFGEACDRWADAIVASLPANNGQGAYAEHYGRCIHFLWRLGRVPQARALAGEACHQLWDGGLFRTHPGEHRYDAVDGPGWLLLALLALETGTEP